LPIINAPKKVDLLTLEILQERLRKAIEGKFSPEIIAGLELEVARREFGKDSPIVEKLALKQKLDPLPHLPQSEKNEVILNASAPGTSYAKYVISSNIDSFITRALQENEKFADLPYMEQVGVLEKFADEIKPVIALAQNAEGLPIEETPTDVEAEAAAKLKGSVGGAQVITSFAEKVFTGQIDYSAAVQSIMFLFKIDEAQAVKLLGKPNKNPNAGGTGENNKAA
jgi:hypothetical protein